ncbi:MAG: ornithine carbamoyltransferase [Verrucomicrobia bacterium]|nr:ornithine carbamoyltransferase [Verrucomicrobiota bacterium]
MTSRHLVSIEKLSANDMNAILAAVPAVKQKRGTRTESVLSAEISLPFFKANKQKRNPELPLAGQTWALIFAKASTRTRVSFEVGIHELGGRPMFLSAADIQLGRGEPIKDTARVMGRMIHGAVIRTFKQSDVEDFASYSKIPTINALTDDEHPCQILADIFTFQEKRGSIAGKTVAFVGDAACNVANSWIWAAAKFGFELRLAAPKQFQPSAELLKRAGGKISVTDDIKAAAAGADLLYTDVWISMGKEAESAERFKILTGYQINAGLVKLAKPGALVMHCLPAYRGNEIDDATLEAHADTIFEEAENRLHVQKAIMQWLVS